jgi:hypothetical protein
VTPRSHQGDSYLPRIDVHLLLPRETGYGIWDFIAGGAGLEASRLFNKKQNSYDTFDQNATADTLGKPQEENLRDILSISIPALLCNHLWQYPCHILEFEGMFTKSRVRGRRHG